MANENTTRRFRVELATEGEASYDVISKVLTALEREGITYTDWSISELEEG